MNELPFQNAVAALETRGTSPSPSPSHARVPRRWFAIGDPQTRFATFAHTLHAQGLLGTDGWLDPDVGLVSMGDHFDYGAPKDADDPADRAAAGREGQLILAWLAAHAPAQVVILLGNHDAARVMELHAFDDARFCAARADSYRVGGDGEVAFLERYPIPASGLARRDFSTFSVAQQQQVQRLLLEGRMRLSHVGTHQGAPCLFTHAGITQRELALLRLDGRASPAEVHAALDDHLDAALARVRPAWEAGQAAALSIAPLHIEGVPGEECGGLLAHRPSNPDRPDIRDRAWEWNPERPRRFSPAALPLAFDQAVGHTGRGILQRDLTPWNEGLAASPGALHTLHVGPGEGVDATPLLECGIAAERRRTVRLFLLDPAFSHLAAGEVPQLFALEP